MNSNEWEKKFSEWSSPPAKYEQDRINNAVNAIRKCIQNDKVLKDKDIEIFVQGSYKNNVNVKKDSDVDVGVLYKNTFNYDSSIPSVKQHIKNKYKVAEYQFAAFKNDIHRALISYF